MKREREACGTMEALRRFLRSEFTGWKKREVGWLILSSGIVLALSLYWKESLTGILAALTGIFCVVLTGKGKRSSFLFGTVNVLLYAQIALTARYYGEVMLNLLYYFPMNFVGWVVWKKHMNAQTGEVIKRRLPLGKSLFIYGGTALGIFLYGLLLKRMGGQLPFVDSMSTVISVAAQILSIWRLTEQWVLWIVVDVVTIFMWGVNFAQGGETIGVLLMWVVYLLNAIFMFLRWNREVKTNEV